MITQKRYKDPLMYLSNVTKRPEKSQTCIFQQLFEDAELTKSNTGNIEQYEESLKTYRDLKNVIDTAFDEGEAKGKVEEKKANITKALKRGKLSIAEIAEDFEVPLDFVTQIKQESGL